MSEQVTIVTAFVDIGRGEWGGVKNGELIPSYICRPTEIYFNRFEKLTKLKNPIVCFTETKFFDRIKKMREDIALIAIDSLFDDHKHLITAIERIQSDPLFIGFVRDKASPERWSPQYVMINLMKSFFVNYVVEQNLSQTGTVAWIDFGYARKDDTCPVGLDWKFDTKDKINLFANVPQFDHKPIFDIVRTGVVYVQGCHIVAPAHKWKLLRDMVNAALANLLNVGLIDDDQTLLLMALRSSPDDFLVQYNGGSDWFTIFNNFHHDD